MKRIGLKFRKIFISLSLIILMGCEVKYQPINYGADKCSFCHMSIVDQRFGAEVVTKKGKIFKFDAVECMINHIHENTPDESDLKFILSNTLDAPSQLFDASGNVYLISENMPSPMGMFLNPFKDRAEAQKSQDQNGGQILSWSELRAEFAKYQ